MSTILAAQNLYPGNGTVNSVGEWLYITNFGGATGNILNWLKVSTMYSSRSTVGLNSDGNLYVWGSNEYGELGLGYKNNTKVLYPVRIGSDKIWKDISCGELFFLSLDSDGIIYAGGRNDYGQLGDNTLNDNTSRKPIASSSFIFGTTGNSPYGIAIDSNNNIYTTNAGSNTVTKITQQGVSSVFGTTGSGPVSIAIDSNNNIYTANSTSNTVTKITQQGVSSVFGTTGSRPYGIAIDSNNNIYTSNIGSDTVTKITPEGVVSTFGTTGSLPSDIAIDSNNNIYTSNLGSDTVTKITPEGVVSTFGTTGSQPSDIAIDSNNNIYTSHQASYTVTKITQQGVSSVFGTTGSNSFNIAIDSNNNIYITNSNLNIVTKITQQGDVSAFGTTVSFAQDIAIDSNNNIYTANADSNNVTKITSESPSFISISAGRNFALAIDADGGLWSWGNNDGSQLGNGGGANRYYRDRTGIDTDWTAIAAGFRSSLALKSDGSLYSWGSGNTLGRTIQRTDYPTIISYPTNPSLTFTKISINESHAMALGSDGNIYTWGNMGSWLANVNNDGSTPQYVPAMIYNNTLNQYTEIVQSNTWVHIYAGYHYSLAINSIGELWGWGINVDYGDGSAINNTPIILTKDNKTWVHIENRVGLVQAIPGPSPTPSPNPPSPTPSVTPSPNPPTPTPTSSPMPPSPTPSPFTSTNCFSSWTGATIQNPIFYQGNGDLVQDQGYYNNYYGEGYISKINIINNNLQFGQDIISGKYYILINAIANEWIPAIGKIYVRNTGTNLDGEYRLTRNVGTRYELTCANCFNSEFWRLASFIYNITEANLITISFYDGSNNILQTIGGNTNQDILSITSPQSSAFITDEPNTARIYIATKYNNTIANQVAGGYLSITHPSYGTTYYSFDKPTGSNVLILTCASSISPPAPSPTPTPSASPLCVNNLINGNFENNLTGWVYEDIGLEQLGTTIGLNNNHWVDLNSCQLGYIEQTINTNIGYSYTIYYCLSGNNFTRDDNIYPIKEGRISVRPEGESIDNITGSEDFSFDITTATYNISNPKDIDMNWTNKSFIFTATSDRTTLRFQGLAPANNCFGAAIDNVSVIESNCYHQRDCNSPSPTPTPTPTSTPIFMSADPISFRISNLIPGNNYHTKLVLFYNNTKAGSSASLDQSDFYFRGNRIIGTQTDTTTNLITILRKTSNIDQMIVQATTTNLDNGSIIKTDSMFASCQDIIVCDSSTLPPPSPTPTSSPLFPSPCRTIPSPDAYSLRASDQQNVVALYFNLTIDSDANIDSFDFEIEWKISEFVNEWTNGVLDKIFWPYPEIYLISNNLYLITFPQTLIQMRSVMTDGNIIVRYVTDIRVRTISSDPICPPSEWVYTTVYKGDG